MRKLIWCPLVVMLGCAHKPETKTTTTAGPPPAPAAPTATASAATPSDPSCASDLDCHADQLCIRSRCVDISANLAECNDVHVHFAFNSSDIDPGDKPGLERSARCLKGDHALHVTIAGNADERGTEEYNLALGDRRATTVRGYLESLGASTAQLQTVSYGKEHPLCVEHDEACWAKNRRADMNGSETASARPARSPRTRR